MKTAAMKKVSKKSEKDMKKKGKMQERKMIGKPRC